MKLLVATILVMTILFNACAWIEPPPNYARAEYVMGAKHGCLRTLLFGFGPVKSDDEALDRVEFCSMMAKEANSVRTKYDEGLRNQLPTAIPGSGL